MQKICYQFNQSIWKVLPFSNGKLLLELRDKKNYTASWKVIDTKQEHVHSSHEIETNSWWFNSIETQPPYFFLHELRQGKTPEIVSLNVIDTTRQTTDRKLLNNTLDSITPDGFTKTDSTGNIETVKLNNLTLDKSPCTTPTLYLETSEHFTYFREAIKAFTDNEALRQCEYIETEKLVVFSYFHKNEGNLSCSLLVLSTEGTVMLQDEMINGLDGVFTESFSLINDKIVYIKNDNEIHILD